MFQLSSRCLLTPTAYISSNVRFLTSVQKWRQRREKLKKQAPVRKPGVVINDTIMPHIPVTHELHNIVKWRAVDKVPFTDPRISGCVKDLPTIDPNWLKLEYQPFADQLDKLPEDERKWFTVGFKRRSEAMKIIYDMTFKQVRRHKYDGIVEQSMEHKIAWTTVRIRDLRLLAKSSYANKNFNRVTKPLRDLVEKRKKFLNQLRHQDYRRFEWLIEILGIVFVPNARTEVLWRKKCVERLTDLICEDIKSQKMNAYKEELEKEKIPFLEDKLAILQEIRGDEESMNLVSSVTADIERTIRQLENLKRTHLEITPLNEEVIHDNVQLP